MRWIAEITQPKPLRFVITPDSAAGFYIYIYDGKRMIYDYLQDTLEIAKDFIFEKFNVPVDAWMPVDQPMRWQAEMKPLSLVIKNDLVIGFYLLVFKDGHRTKDESPDMDTLDQAKTFALKTYGVPLDSWSVLG